MGPLRVRAEAEPEEGLPGSGEGADSHQGPTGSGSPWA